MSATSRRGGCGQSNRFQKWNAARVEAKAKARAAEERLRRQVEEYRLVGWDADGRECVERDYRYVPPGRDHAAEPAAPEAEPERERPRATPGPRRLVGAMPILALMACLGALPGDRR